MSVFTVSSRPGPVSTSRHRTGCVPAGLPPVGAAVAEGRRVARAWRAGGFRPARRLVDDGASARLQRRARPHRRRLVRVVRHAERVSQVYRLARAGRYRRRTRRSYASTCAAVKTGNVLFIECK